MAAFSTNIATMGTTNDDKMNEDWDMWTNNIIMNNPQSNSDEEYLVFNNDNTHKLEYGFQEDNKAWSATFFYPDKIMLSDGITDNIINKINLQNTDKVTLHNIRHH